MAGARRRRLPARANIARLLHDARPTRYAVRAVAFQRLDDPHLALGAQPGRHLRELEHVRSTLRGIVLLAENDQRSAFTSFSIVEQRPRPTNMKAPRSRTMYRRWPAWISHKTPPSGGVSR